MNFDEKQKSSIRELDCLDDDEFVVNKNPLLRYFLLKI